MYKVIFSKQAVKDIEKLKKSNLLNKAKSIVKDLKENPFGLPYE